MPAFLPVPDATLPDRFLPALLEVSLSGVLYLLPQFNGAGEIVDFSFAYLNSTAQRILELPARPTLTYLQRFPHAPEAGLLAFYQSAFASQQRQEYVTPYPAGTQEFLVWMAARRVEEGVLVSFTSVTETDWQAVQATVQQGEQHEAEAYAEANRQRAQFYYLLEQAPAMICILEGPEHVFQFVNSAYQAMAGPRTLLGRPIAEAMPEMLTHRALTQLRHVYRTGETYYAAEMLVPLLTDGQQEPEKRYHSFIFQARRNALGSVDGILVFAYDVTAQVTMRHLLQQQQDELEQRVLSRTQAAEKAQHVAEQDQVTAEQAQVTAKQAQVTAEQAQVTAEQAQRVTEEQRQQLNRLLMQVPAAICVLAGPDLVFELVNPSYQQAFPGRPLLGRPLLAALPELHSSPIPGILAQVYATGETAQVRELPLRIARTEGSALEDTFWTFTYQARRDAQGRIDGVLVFAYELTAQVRARQAQETLQEHTQAMADQLQRTNEQLQRVNADLDTFVHMASHDLKAPITNIEGLLHALQQELQLPAAEADTTTILRLMQDSVRRFQRTIHYLADVSKWQQSATQPVVPVSLAELVESVRLDLAPLLLLSGGRITLAADSCPTIVFPEKQLRSIVFNLLSNALKYRAPGRAPEVQVLVYQPQRKRSHSRSY